ncbi:lysylphosphatidylglycerol synthase transmembrane domain-containing protein [Pleurocapsa sp. PCC 7319]|uniref:lysylphosphatidylglycerol synthase transmembrane domain-containing protein n=1 Tax=Pleurocapsa sp. PCC 7319 TaxID=118161 RepID=UPI000345E275|nr:lysylphosphatidylglycerol synthase transmembrane domain-containing protein [Pleurocapsa sp. PCC 7319]
MNLKRFVSLVISVAILLYIYAQIDVVNLLQVFQNCDRLMLAISLGMVIPITLITAWRLQQLVPQQSLGFLEANRLILGASVLNMVLPSKMGDIAKAYFMCERSNLSGGLALAISIFEKACDLLSLLLWCVFGLILYPAKDPLFWTMTLGVATGLALGLLLLSSQQFADLFFNLAISFAPKSLKIKLQKMQVSWREMYSYFWSNKPQLLLISSTSVFIWFLHLLQIWLFILALKAFTPFIISLALSPLSILAGLLPLTFAGIGTRDAAIIYFYQNYLSDATGAALGLLCTSRYFIPALIGLPFLGQMLSAAKKIND